MTPGLTDFLQDRLDEDEAAARMAQTVQADGWYEVAQQAIACTDTVEIGPAYQHIARHDPARVLREVEARRGRVTRYQEALQQQGSPGDVAYEWWNGKIVALLQELRADAAVYSDHEGYRQAWKP